LLSSPWHQKIRNGRCSSELQSCLFSRSETLSRRRSAAPLRSSTIQHRLSRCQYRKHYEERKVAAPQPRAYADRSDQVWVGS
jgi:hypothetical protein